MACNHRSSKRRRNWRGNKSGRRPISGSKLEEEEQKSLAHRRGSYHPVPDRGGGRDGDEEAEGEEPIQGFPLLHQIQHHQLQLQHAPSNYAQLGSDLPQFLLQQEQQSGRRRAPQPSRGGEIVEVQGGHIVRSTGRKDRHSKVCTAKGPRDRRVRLSAHTAIQFYDVQDRLGYDRPSKAVDWLMKNAKAAIDELAELPAWQPTNFTNAAVASSEHLHDDLESPGASNGKRHMEADEPSVSVAFGFGAGGSGTSFLPPSLDSDAIANTIKSFFPTATATAATPSHSAHLDYHNYSQDVLSRSSSQDLRLSLQSFQDPAHHHSHHHQNLNVPAQHSLFSHPTPLGFDPGWAEQSQRMAPWSVTETGGGGYMLNAPPEQAMPPHLVLGHGQFFSQRGPLQSSSSSSVRAWADPMPPAADQPIHPSFHQSFSEYPSGSVYSGFRIPARIQGEEEEEQDGVSDKPSSASSASLH